jgi:hypothetical protein
VKVADIIRQLADKIVLTPVAEEESCKSLSIDLHGHLAGIVAHTDGRWKAHAGMIALAVLPGQHS